MTDESIDKALKLFELTPPVTQEQLNQRREQLLHVWNPHRFANLTNNPKKYMQMVKKGEAMTKEIEEAYRLLLQSVVGKSV
jgi:6-phosphogluconate dehydrogenase